MSARPLLALMLAALFAASAAPRGPSLPPIAFVSRKPLHGADSLQVPGLGPHGSTVRTTGVLLVREPDGRVQGLYPKGALIDVQDPDVSPDGASIVCSGRAPGDSAWILWVVPVAGGLPRALLPAGRTRDGHVAHDVDPCWLEGGVVFASTRDGVANPYDGAPVFNLWWLAAGGGVPHRLTWERVGALDPFLDARTKRLAYSRWWFNPWRSGEGGVTRDLERSAARDTVNQWQLVSVALAPGEPAPRAWDERLLAGGSPDRRAGMGVQGARLADGSIVATYARNTGLAPTAAGAGVHRFAPGAAAGARLTGVSAEREGAPSYELGTGLAAPTACAPAALPGGGAVCAMDRGARGDFGLWWLPAGAGKPEPLVDLPRTLELDPAPIVRRAITRVIGAQPSPREDGAGFRYVNRDVFAGKGAPARTAGARLRFWRALPREADADTAVLLREVAVPRSGAVDVRELPEHAALFEQLVDVHGAPLATAHGPAQVRGFNTGDRTAPARCSGCHLGHSKRR